jgi:hypothetical protein
MCCRSYYVKRILLDDGDGENEDDVAADLLCMLERQVVNERLCVKSEV